MSIFHQKPFDAIMPLMFPYLDYDSSIDHNLTTFDNQRRAAARNQCIRICIGVWRFVGRALCRKSTIMEAGRKHREIRGGQTTQTQQQKRRSAYSMLVTMGQVEMPTCDAPEAFQFSSSSRPRPRRFLRSRQKCALGLYRER
jgi:hypothetical protein